MIKTVTLSPGEEGGERGREREKRKEEIKGIYHIKPYVSVSIVLWIIIHSKCGR